MLAVCRSRSHLLSLQLWPFATICIRVDNGKLTAAVYIQSRARRCESDANKKKTGAIAASASSQFKQKKKAALTRVRLRMRRVILLNR